MQNLTSDSDAPVIVKLGGSLLTISDLQTRLTAMLQSLKGFRFLIVTGGGAAADEIRRLDRLLSLSDEQSHWAAIAAMSFHSQLLGRIWRPACNVVASREQAELCWRSNRIAILDVEQFMKAEESPLLLSGEKRQNHELQNHLTLPLPASWDVTSDSIAAWIACRWPTRRLLLVKSCDRTVLSPEDLACAGLVDKYFPKVARNLAVDWFNLRNNTL